MTCCSATACSLFDLAAGRRGAACRTFGVHRSTYYAWKRQVDRHGLEMLRPRERRRPQMPNPLPAMVEERIVELRDRAPRPRAAAIASELAREKWGGIVVSPNGVWKVCAVTASTRAPSAWPGRRLRRSLRAAARTRARAAHRRHAAGRAGRHRLLLRRTAEGHHGAIWQLTAIDCYSSYAWAELVPAPQGNPTAAQTRTLARRVAATSSPPAGNSSACSPTTATSTSNTVEPVYAT